MATQFSIDLFLEEIDIIFMYLVDGHVLYIQGYESLGRRYEGGDLIKISRETAEKSPKDEDLAVVLGWGESREEAVAASKAYIRRVAKWHGDSNELEEEVSLSLFGFDLSQSEALMRSLFGGEQRRMMLKQGSAGSWSSKLNPFCFCHGMLLMLFISSTLLCFGAPFLRNLNFQLLIHVIYLVN